jgi:1,2-phenylacetyl-CoA epoxidase PaaB subunit
MDTIDEGEVFEVFQQDSKDPHPHHGGNLRAPDAELAVHYAKEFYGRRQESQKLWIVPRSALIELPDLSDTVAESIRQTYKAVEQRTGSQAFAVFGQKQAGKAFTWIQDTQDATPFIAIELALHIAQASAVSYVRLWLCPRSAVMELTDANLLQPPLDRSYRRLDGYNIREKLRAARQRVQEQGEAHHE